MPDRVPSAAQVRQALAELMAWPEIARSPQLARFLAYIVEKKLDGEEAAIKAYAIAVDVFGRPTSFDPQADPIVRVQARRLRALLDQYRAEGKGEAEARIVLPVGRYVPQFIFGADEEPVAAVPQPARPAPAAPARAPVRWLRVGLGALAVLALVVLAVIGNWAAQNLAGQRQAAESLPQMPRVLVAGFSNLTGSARYEPLSMELSLGVASALGRFDDLIVLKEGPARPGDFLVSGVMRSVEKGIEITTLVSRESETRGGQPAIVWSVRSVEPFPDGDAGAAVRAAAGLAASQLGAFRGPLHEPGRIWLSAQASLPGEPNVYVCQLQYQLARELQRSKDVVAGLACLDRMRERRPDEPLTLAAWSVLEAGVIAAQAAAPDQPLSVRLADPMAQVQRAVELAPESSFVREQQGEVLALQREVPAAETALAQALALNPANQMARARLGVVEALSGRGDFGLDEVKLAIASVPQPPPWFHLPLAVDALKHRQFGKAMDLADAMSQGESDLGQLLGLAAAGGAGDQAQMASRLSRVMANERLRRDGIGAWLGAAIADRGLLKTLKDGLLTAGVSQAAMDKAF